MVALTHTQPPFESHVHQKRSFRRGLCGSSVDLSLRVHWLGPRAAACIIMLRNTFQQQYISIFCSDKDSKPLQLWRVISDNEASAVQFVQDPDVTSQVLQVGLALLAPDQTRCAWPANSSSSARSSRPTTSPTRTLNVRPTQTTCWA